MELWILFLQHPEFCQGSVKVAPLWQQDSVAQHRLQTRWCPGGLSSQTLPRKGPAQASDSADYPCRGLFYGLKFTARVNPDLIGLLLPYRLWVQVFPAVGQELLYAQGPASDLQIGEPGPLRVTGNLVYLGPKNLRPLRPGSIPLQSIQKGIYSLQLKRRAKPAGEELPPGHKPG